MLTCPQFLDSFRGERQLQRTLRESDKLGQKLSEGRLNSLNKEAAKASQRLSRLYAAKLDVEITDVEVFKIKETEYKASVVENKAQIRTLEQTNPAFYENACKILELSQQMFSLFFRSNLEQ